MEKNHNIKHFNNFQREIKKLLALYNANEMIFPEKIKEIREKTKSWEIDPMNSFFLDNIENDENYIARNAYELKNKLRSGFLKSQRELIFIRAISALEVLLIELVRETFLHKKYLFHSNKKIEFNQSELLASDSLSSIWSKIINQECRRLQNKSFLGKRKYYLKTFSIDFSNSDITLNEMEYLHNIRHLLVHRLWKTDSAFKIKYKTTKKTVTIEKDDFYKYITKIISFGSYLGTEVKKLIDLPKALEKNGSVSKGYNLEIKLYNQEYQKLFLSDFSFISWELICLLRDILISYNKSEDIIYINIKGEKNIISDYLKYIKWAERKGFLEISKKQSNNEVIYTPKQMELVKNYLEKESINKSNIKNVSEKLNVDKKIINKIIRFIERNKHYNEENQLPKK